MLKYKTNMNVLTQRILRPTTELERHNALVQLWELTCKGAIIPEELQNFIRHHKTRNNNQATILGLLLWKLEGCVMPPPAHILVRAFPGLFDDDHSTIQKSVQTLFGSLRTAEFFKQTSERNLIDAEKDELESWYAMRILSNYTLEICKAYDKRQQ
jgi:hypothetical protein